MPISKTNNIFLKFHQFYWEGQKWYKSVKPFLPKNAIQKLHDNQPGYKKVRATLRSFDSHAFKNYTATWKLSS